MIVLSDPQKLEVVLGGAVTTNQLPVVVSFVDVNDTTYSPLGATTITNNTTAVTVVFKPGPALRRQVKFISIYNADTVNATVTLRYNDDGTNRSIVVVTLAAGSTLFYTDGEGFRVMTTAGAIL